MASHGRGASGSGGQALSQGAGLAPRYRRLDEHRGPGAIARGTFGKVFVAVDGEHSGGEATGLAI